VKKKFFNDLVDAVKEMKAVMSKRKPSSGTSYRTLSDGTVLRTVTHYDKNGRVVRTETEHLTKPDRT